MEREKKFQATVDTNSMGDILRKKANSYYDHFPDRWEKEFHGKPVGAPVVTRYPNLLAEMVVMGSQIDVIRLSSAAPVSPQVLVAVIEDGEELSASEMAHIVKRLNAPTSGRHPVRYGYLASPKVSIVYPNTNKGRIQALEFERTYDKAWSLRTIGDYERAVITAVRQLLQEKKHSFYYAAYRYAMNAMESEISFCAWADELRGGRTRTRTTRRVSKAHA